MEQNNQIDELFRNGLSKEYPYDPNLWNQLESELPLDSKPRAWYFNLNSLLILTLSVISLVLKSDNNMPYSQTEEVGIDTQKVKVEAVTKETHADKVNNSTAKKQIKTSDDEVSTDSKTSNVNTSTISHKSQANIPNKTKKIDSQNNLKLSKSAVLHTNNSLSNVKNETSTNNLSYHQSIINKNALNNDEQFNDILSPLNFKPLWIEQYLLNAAPQNKTQKFKNPLRSSSNVYEIEMNRSFIAEKQIKNLNSSIEPYRSDRESVAHNFQFGLNTIKHKKNWLYGIGVRYNSYVESMRYDVLGKNTVYDIDYDTSYKVVNGSFNSNGVPVLLIERNITENRSSREVNVYKPHLYRNEIKRLQVPIFIGLHKSFGNIYTSLRGGLALNYTYRAIGGYINESQTEVVSFSEAKALNEFVIGQHLNANFGYSLNEYFVIGLRSSYESDVTSFTKDYESKFSNYNLGIWLMWRPE